MDEEDHALLREHDRSIVRMEAWIDDVKPVVESRGTDLEALKLGEKESKTQLRLIMGVGGLLGTLLVSLIVFAATRGA